MKQQLVWIPVRRPRTLVPQTDVSNCVISATPARKPRHGCYNGCGYSNGYPWYYYNMYTEQRYPYV